MKPYRPWRNLFVRVAMAAVGLLFVSASSVVLSGWLSLANALRDQPEPPIQEPWQRGDAYYAAEGDRTRSLILQEVNGVLSAEWRLVSRAEDPVVKAVAAGEASNAPQFFVSEVATILFDPAGTSSSMTDWSITPPTVQVEGVKSTLQARARGTLLGSRAQILLGGSCSRCVVNVEVRSDKYLVSGLAPTQWPGAESKDLPPPAELSVTSREANTAKFVIGTDPVVLTLTDATSGSPPTGYQTFDWGLKPWQWSDLQYVWRTLCFTAPWLMLLVVPLPLLRGSRDKRNVGLMLSGLLLALYVTVAAGSVEDLLRRAANWITELTGERFFGYGGTVFAALLGVVWAGATLSAVVQSPRMRTAVRGYLAVVALAASAVVAGAFAVGGPGSVRFAEESTNGYAGPAMLASFLGCLLLVRALSVGSVGAGTQLLIAFAGAAAVGAMVTLSSTGVTVTAWAVGIAALVFDAVFVATLLTVPLTHVVRDYLNSTDRKRWVHRLPWIWFLLFALCIWITFPQERSIYSLAPLSPSDVYRVAYATVGAAKVALFAGLLALLWNLSKGDQEWKRPNGRVLAVIIGSAMLLRPEVLFGNFLPVSFIVGLLLLNSVLVPRDVPLTGPGTVSEDGSIAMAKPGKEPADDVPRIARAGNRHRLLRELEQTLAKKAASGEMSLEDVDKEVAQFREYARTSAEAGVADADPKLRLRAFGSGHAGPWHRALIGAGVAAVAGLPGFLQALASLSQLENLEGAVPVLSASTTIILILRYPLYGLFFGYFLPWFRGDTAVVKSMYFFVVLGVSESIVLLLPYRQDQDVMGAFLSWVAQIFLICFALGVAFDYLVLRNAGLRIGALLDVHHTSRLVAFSSAVVASVATAAAAVLASSAIDIVAEKITGGR